MKNVCVSIIRNFSHALSVDLISIMKGNSSLSIPRFPHSVIKQLVDDVKQILSEEPMVIEINEPVIVVGDIHGHLLDLVRIFWNFGYPPAQKYLFLGDYVDRGEFSTECILMIYALKYLYPSHIYLIRGNHEFPATGSGGGFADEIEIMYRGMRLFNSFCESFAFMPLGAILFNKVFCTHGGICPEFSELKQVREIPRPLNDCDDALVNGIIWSDPSFQISDFSQSRRGTGWVFGGAAVAAFLEANSLKMMIRAHEVMDNGCEFAFDGKLLTVFSASNYCGMQGNSAAVAIVRSSEDIETVQMSPLGYIPRASVVHTEPLDDITDEMLAARKMPNIMKVRSVVFGNICKSGNVKVRRREATGEHHVVDIHT